MIDLTGGRPIDPIFGGWLKRIITAYKQEGVTLTPSVKFKGYVDRPAGGMQFRDVVIVPFYDFRVLTCYKWDVGGVTYSLSHDLVREGDLLEVEEYDGRKLWLVVKRRYNPAGEERYLTLECTEQLPSSEPSLELINQ